MSDEKTVVLCVSTDTVGSKCSCDMGYTIAEWREMDMDEQNSVINEYMANVCDVWVEASDGSKID
jgi:hypothetical protein